MRKILQLSVLVLFIITSCSTGSSQKENKYLGKTPLMVADFQNGQKKLEEKAENSEDFEELMKLDKELKDFRKGYDEKMEAYLNETKTLAPIPVKILNEKPFKIKNAVINALGTNNLNLKLTLDVTDEVPFDTPGRQTIWVYYKAVDSQGNDISGTKTVASNVSRKKIIPGTEYEVFGSWSAGQIINMEDFAGIVEITKEEYSRH